MAAAETTSRPQGTQGTQNRHSHRRRPFSSWVKKLTKKTSSDNPASTSKKSTLASPSKSKKYGSLKNNPYPESGYLHRQSIASSANGQLSMTPTSNARNSFAVEDGAGEERKPPVASNRSAAPTVATNAGTINSDAGQSKAGTSNTAVGGLSSNEGAGNSTFSSPNHSERSLTTTLTTIQSTAPSTMLGGPVAAGTGTASIAHPPHTPTVQFSHQFPSSPPPSAIPHHLAPQGNPTTYTTATANNILTDNASILTLASSSKRRRRHSLDTDASVRALAPSSVWGGSRESLPLSVLSANMDTTPAAATAGLYESHSRSRPSVGGLASAERASVYSSSGIAPPTLSSERNSYYASKQGHDGASVRSGLLGHASGGGGAAGGGADGASMRSGLLGHGRNDSITGSIGGMQGGGTAGAPTSPLTSPREFGPGKMGLSRRSSDWKADADGLSDGDGDEAEEHAIEEVAGQPQAAEARADESVSGAAKASSKTQDEADMQVEIDGGNDGNDRSSIKYGDREKENEKPF